MAGDKFFQLRLHKHGSASVLDVRGSVGMYEAQRLRQKLNILVARNVPMIILELSEMDFICSTGLGVLISAHLNLSKHGGSIRLVNPTENVAELLDTTRLSDVFTIFKTVEQAASASIIPQ